MKKIMTVLFLALLLGGTTSALAKDHSKNFPATDKPNEKTRAVWEWKNAGEKGEMSTLTIYLASGEKRVVETTSMKQNLSGSNVFWSDDLKYVVYKENIVKWIGYQEATGSSTRNTGFVLVLYNISTKKKIVLEKQDGARLICCYRTNYEANEAFYASVGEDDLSEGFEVDKKTKKEKFCYNFSSGKVAKGKTTQLSRCNDLQGKVLYEEKMNNLDYIEGWGE